MCSDNHLPLTVETAGKLLGRQLEERLPHEPTTRVEDGRCERSAGPLLGDGVECSLNALRVRQIGADAEGLSAAGFDLFHDRLIAGRSSRKEHHWVCLGESSGYRGALTSCQRWAV